MAYSTLNIDLGKNSYDILIGKNLINNIFDNIKNIIKNNKVFIITDENVAALHLQKLTMSLKDNSIKYEVITLPAGESTKSFKNLEYICETILAQNIERNSVIIAFGGGVIGDITGFVASILLRGINFIQIPTTLLAQVDSSVGGKTAINAASGKNLIGSFYQPEIVIIDIDFLKTLPTRQFLAGYAEVIKYGLIFDVKFFNFLDDNIDQILAKSANILQDIIHTSCDIKAKIVSLDEKEQNIRAILNLGHTFGHALEHETGYSDLLFHGEGVAVGMCMAAYLSYLENLCSIEIFNKTVAHLQKIGLPTSLKDINFKFDINKLLNSMQKDKKVTNGKLKFILLDKIGNAVIKDNVNIENVRKTLIHLS